MPAAMPTGLISKETLVAQPVKQSDENWSPSMKFVPVAKAVPSLTSQVTTSVVPEASSAPIGKPVSKRNVTSSPKLSYLNANTGEIPMAMPADVRPALIKGTTYSTPSQSSISLPYRQMLSTDLKEILDRTPKPKGKREWSSIHIIHCESTPGMEDVKVSPSPPCHIIKVLLLTSFWLYTS